MEHDPMCGRENGANNSACYCDLIARVRADERVKARQRVEGFCTGHYSADPCTCAVMVAKAAAAAGGDA